MSLMAHLVYLSRLEVFSCIRSRSLIVKGWLQVPVRPFRHNEFERFLTAAYPYYAATASTMAAFFLFTLAFLHHK